jgi:hypothetical protein
MNQIDLDNKPELKWVDIKEMFVDPAYQRTTASEASQKNLKWLIDNFSWSHCGALIVAFVPSKKKYAVLDGQHRLKAATARGDIKQLPCLVITGMDVQKQASSFVVINTKRVTMNSIAKYHAAVAAGEQEAVSIQAILDECKIEVPRTQIAKGDTGARQVQAVSTLISLLDRYSKKQIIWALTAIPDAYGEEQGQLRASLIKAVAEFIKNNPEADRDRFVRMLGEHDPLELEQNARSYVAINGGTTTAAMLVALERHYKNAGRKGAL